MFSTKKQTLSLTDRVNAEARRAQARAQEIGRIINRTPLDRVAQLIEMETEARGWEELAKAISWTQYQIGERTVIASVKHEGGMQALTEKGDTSFHPRLRAGLDPELVLEQYLAAWASAHSSRVGARPENRTVGGRSVMSALEQAVKDQAERMSCNELRRILDDHKVGRISQELLLDAPISDETPPRACAPTPAVGQLTGRDAQQAINLLG